MLAFAWTYVCVSRAWRVALTWGEFAATDDAFLSGDELQRVKG